MECFMCRFKFIEVNDLAKHLKKTHNLGPNSTLICFESSCGQFFTNINSYKRHILRKHISPNDNLEQNRTPCENMDVSISDNNISRPVSNCYIVESVLKNSNTNFNINQNLQNIYENALKFSTFLHSKNNFARKDVFDIQEKVTMCLIDPILNMFKQFAQTQLSNDLNTMLQNQMISIIFSCQDVFKNCGTDYCLSQNLKKMGYMDDIKEFTITSDVQPVYCQSELVYAEKKVKGSVLPILSQFKTFFEQGDNLMDMLNYMAELKSNTRYTNFVQGPVWKKKSEMYESKTVIPYFLYADDFCVNNPLGSHATSHSVCNFYYSFPCFRINNSKLENVFLAAVIKSKDLKEIGNDDCLEFLIRELRFLEENGVDIHLKDGTVHKIHFIMGLFLGDNLGVNTLLEFSKSFSSGSFCRFCKAQRTDCNKLSVEQKAMMRTVENYKCDIDYQDPTKTGIMKDSCFNKIPSFHVVENFCVDAMHDICEGILHYDLCQIILYLLQDMHYLTSLSILNQRKQTFDYGSTEIGNFSGEIKLSHLKSKHLKMSAREMLTFAMYLPLMIGDLVPAEDEIWQFLIILIDIIDLILCFEVTDDLVLTLQRKIKIHNNQYVKLFKDTLKPKFHFLTHYPTVLKNSGPVRNFWCFKFEAKHKSFKAYAHSITSRKNICLTLAKKFQLKFANDILHSKNNPTEYQIDEKRKCNTAFLNIIVKKLKLNESNNISCFNQITFKGIKYNVGLYVSTCFWDYKIYLIKTIFRIENKVYLFCQQLTEINFNSHFSAFEIHAEAFGEYRIIKFKDLLGPPLTIINTHKGKKFIKIKEYFLYN